jgi:chromosome segregation ATPase
MPGDDSLSSGSGDHGSVLVQMSRMGERVAGLEARLEALKGDTETTRSSIHAINGELQKIVIVEEGCRQSLLHLTNQVTTLVNAAPAIQAAVQTFEGMRADLRAILSKDTARNSMIAMLTRLVPWLVVSAGFFWWAWQHLAIKP